MEYMRIEGFLGGAISKLINKGIESKFGYKPDIKLNQFNLRTIDKVEHNMLTDSEIIHDDDSIIVDLSLSMSQADFNKLMEEATK